ncbi:P-loop NTPase family protein [Lichenicoccus roseus]|uniref:ABC transporter ATP-binding protein n=1 Tax=Lichenicoccus roseus TaxID=2683649 RepID=A0A5R9JBR0_9PROT|nr:ABC transporter ATP-binding protein [Lichenicoccus roseus]TLU74183.1 ABC transporter ATP-binding protein [Lichenicoccus roseus]
MKATDPVLELAAARPFFDQSALPNTRFDLRLMAGECALVVTHDADRATALSDLCSGMLDLRDGAVRFMGYNWSELGHEQTYALRGRIGRLPQRGAWIGMLRTHINILLPLLHHTREPLDSLVDQAVELARQVGLPGLPIGRPEAMPEADLMRAACVRAFLGEPRLLLLEHSISADSDELITPLLNLLTRALDRGAAAICFTRDSRLWRTQAFPLAHHLHLLEDGLNPVRSVREKSRQRDATERERTD